MNIANFLGSRGGPASTADFGRAGFTRYRIGRAVAEGTIVRIRRGHYALTRETSAVRAAREAGGLLTCVSAAPGYGLWTLAPAPKLHLCVGHRAAPPCVSGTGQRRPARWHMAAAGIPGTRGSLWPDWPTS